MADGKQVVHSIAPTMRRAFLKALEIRGNRTGQTLPEIVDDLIEREGLLAVMDRMAKFQEKTADINLNHGGEVGLVGILGALSGIGPSESRNTEVADEPGELRH